MNCRVWRKADEINNVLKSQGIFSICFFQQRDKIKNGWWTLGVGYDISDTEGPNDFFKGSPGSFE